MLKSNLKVLLAERNLSITQVSNDTGISRTTLTSLIFGYAKGVQFETMNTICNYLKITPKDLFIYVPYEINIRLEDFKYKYGSVNNYIALDIKILKHQILFICYINTFGKEIDLQIDLYQDLNKEEDKEDFRKIKYYLKNLPIQFLVDIENRIKEIFLDELEYSDFYEKINEEEEIKREDILINIEWAFFNE